MFDGRLSGAVARTLSGCDTTLAFAQRDTASLLWGMGCCVYVRYGICFVYLYVAGWISFVDCFAITITYHSASLSYQVHLNRTHTRAPFVLGTAPPHHTALQTRRQCPPPYLSRSQTTSSVSSSTAHQPLTTNQTLHTHAAPAPAAAHPLPALSLLLLLPNHHRPRPHPPRETPRQPRPQPDRTTLGEPAALKPLRCLLDRCSALGRKR